MRRLLLAHLTTFTLMAPLACSEPGTGPADGGGEAGVPASIQVRSGKTTLVLGTSPLSLSLRHDGAELTAAAAASASDPWAPVSVGRIRGYVSSLYYDPAGPRQEVLWGAGQRVVRATSLAGGAWELVLSGGLSLTLSPDPAVSGAIRLKLEAAAPLDNAAEPQVALSRLCLGVRQREVFFGFGELLDTVSSRGVVRPMQLLVDTSMPSGTNENHAPVPLAISPRGWAMLVRDFNAGAFDVARGNPQRICASFTTHRLLAYLMTDADPLELVERSVSLTARPALPPGWAFAPQQWRNVLNSQSELLADAAAMRQHKIPGSVVWIDNPWQTGYNTFLFDPRQFPSPRDAIARLHAQGYKVLVWSTPYVNEDQTALYREARDNKYLVTDTLGAPVLYRWANGKGTLMDFSAPGATAFWRRLIKRVTDLGVDGFKLDYGEDALVALGAGRSFFRFHGGKTTATMHREYPGLYHRAYLGALPEGQGFLITRAGALGEQQHNTCIWPGDLDRDFSRHSATRVGGLPAAVTAGLSLSVSGYPFFGSDIGGFRGGAPTTEALLRWAGYAALGTIMQLGGGGASHNPWDSSLYDKTALGHYRTYARLHTDLFPTLYSYARKAAETGRPVTRPLGLAFPADQTAWTRDFQYMLGDYMLVAPVIGAGATSWQVYLPAGTWIHHWTREAHRGPATVTVAAPLGQIPLFRKRGAIVAYLATAVDTLAPASDATVTSYEAHRRELLLEVLPPDTRSSFTLFDSTAVRATTVASGMTLEITPGSQFADFRLRVDLKNHPHDPGRPVAVTVAGKTLSKAASAAATASCAGGCWFYDDGAGLLHARVLAPAGKLVIQ
jgi:alpha-D-xyloside xylohydrolase